MIKSEYYVIGVMSGTSLDGIDLAYIKFQYSIKWEFKILVAETISYSTIWEQKLKQLISFSKKELRQIDSQYTKYLAEIIQEFIQKNSIKNIDAICSHGHTALHQPEKGLTYQIGNLPELAAILKQTIVCDFRVKDVELGGQGAPLVPIGDELLFKQFEYCLNLGGFANVSTNSSGKRIAYDICPVNIVLNHYVKLLGFNFDDEGNFAKSGKLNSDLLILLNNLDFYKETHPKSLGLEWVNKYILPKIDEFELSVKDILRTFVEHIAVQISNEINKKENALVFVSGGGVFNKFLMNRIEALSENKLFTPSETIINYKEALIFGLLGVLKLRKENNCLSSVTGAIKNHSSGKIFNS